MEAQEDANSSSSTGESLCQAIIKRKRTKRHRALPMPPPSAAASSASSGTTTNEEEDMANCLILLAQGRTLQVNVGATTTTHRAAGAGLDRLYHLYVCKTCGKSFPSFQALGGHRASHKKPKMAAKDESELTSSTSKPVAFLSIGGGKPRTHECSICRAEFSSGQALGGHMRRHRPTVFPEIGSECKRQKSGFSLDLNLPAPGEDEPFGGGGSGGPDNSLVFSQSPAVAIVDCYY